MQIEDMKKSDEHLARNIRILMSQQDVSPTHLAHILNIPTKLISEKINSKVDFKASELKALAKFFNTNTEKLWNGDVEQNPPPKYITNVEADETDAIEEERAEQEMIANKESKITTSLENETEKRL